MKNNEVVQPNIEPTNADLKNNPWCALALFSVLNPKNICNNIRAKREEKRQKREQEEKEQEEKALQQAAERKERYRKYKAFVDSEIRGIPQSWTEMYSIYCFVEWLSKIENMAYNPYDVREEYDSLEEKKQWELKKLKIWYERFWWLHIESLQYLYGSYEIHRAGNWSWWIYCWCDRVTDEYSYRFPNNITNLLKKYWFTYGFSES